MKELMILSGHIYDEKTSYGLLVYNIMLLIVSFVLCFCILLWIKSKSCFLEKP